MNDIARAAGISRQAVYLHFPSRAALLIATTRYIDQVKEVDERFAASRSAGSARERLDAFIAAWGDYIPEIHAVARALIAMQDHDEAARAAWADRLEAIREGCQAAVEALERERLLDSALSVKEATDLMTGMLSVEQWQHLRERCGWSQARYVAVMQDRLGRMLLG